MKSGKAPAKNIVSKSEYARICGVSLSAVSKALAQGRTVATTKGGIDLRRKINKYFLASHMHPEKKENVPGDELGLPPKKPGADKSIQMFLSRPVVEIRKKILECEKLELQNARTRNELIPTETARRTVADLGEVLRTSLLYLPRRSAAHVLALAQSGAEGHKVEEYLAGEVQKAVSDFKTAAVRRLEEHLVEIEQEEQEIEKNGNGAAG